MDGLADRRMYGAGETIIREGDLGDCFYLLESGQVEVYKTAPNGRKVIIGRIRPGGIFGEMAVIDKEPRMASATATEPSVCRTIQPHMLEKKIAASDKLIQAILRVFAQNIRSITQMQIAAAMKDAGFQ